MITINGKQYEGRSISVMGDTVTIDGIVMTDADVPKNILKIEVHGNLADLTTDKSVTCTDVVNNVQAGGSVSCDNIGGNVSAGGSVHCDDIGGSVNAGGGVRRN